MAAAPEGLGARLGILGRPVVVASEFENLTRRFVADRGWPFVFIRTYGATEVFPPEDADLVLDLTATGTTLRENRLEVVADVLLSSTRFVASKRTIEDPAKRDRIDALGMMLRAVLDARTRVLVEVERPGRSPRRRRRGAARHEVADDSAAVRRAGLRRQGRGPAEAAAEGRPGLKAAGATDLIAYALEQVIP